MIYLEDILERRSNDQPLARWEYEETLEYYLKNKIVVDNTCQDEAKPLSTKTEDAPNLNYAELALKSYEESLDYYLEVIG